VTTHQYNRIVVVFILIFIACVLGCAGFQVKQIMDAATENQIKLMEAKAKIDKEKRQERYIIEGTVKSVKMKEKEIPDPDPTHLKQSKTEKDQEAKLIQPLIRVKYCLLFLLMVGRRSSIQFPPHLSHPGSTTRSPITACKKLSRFRDSVRSTADQRINQAGMS
jgi:hypothetical protein